MVDVIAATIAAAVLIANASPGGTTPPDEIDPEATEAFRTWLADEFPEVPTDTAECFAEGLEYYCLAFTEETSSSNSRWANLWTELRVLSRGRRSRFTDAEFTNTVVACIGQPDPAAFEGRGADGRRLRRARRGATAS